MSHPRPTSSLHLERAHVPTDWWPDEQAATLEPLETLLRETRAAVLKGGVAPARSDAETRSRVDAVDLDRGIGVEAATREAHELMAAGDLLSASARCFGYFNPTAAWPGVVADLLVAARNPQICVVSHAPASAAMERHVIAFVFERLGFPADAVGNFTSGGSEANATGLLVALVRGEEGFAQNGVEAYGGPPCLYASADSHLAWIKLARAAGLGTSAVRLVPTDGHGRMDPAALRARIVEDRKAGRRPVLVAATAGTTNAGAIDPLDATRDIADEFELHLHVDAAWAGALAFAAATA